MIGALPRSHDPETKMKNPLDSLWGAVLAGFVLTVVLYYLARAMMGGWG
jgi:hypothetical protein